MNNQWGDFVTNKRIDAGFTLRAFCIKLEYDCGNWSKMERGIMIPPRSESYLHKEMCRILNLSITQELNISEMSDAARQPLIAENKSLKEQVDSLRNNLALTEALNCELECYIQKLEKRMEEAMAIVEKYR